ncbi:LysE family translocator [Hydrogenophaga intermedia]|uniref:LysE family translocator n=1 Tax=Hydrogenophaga intermedia TaxID=65786 RepID=UPI002042E5FB|nr:LysE family translocator [Hydrogenophaga intermedia]MCM3563380.1 LysE family translocator [Hydrogenophaga intermedia]
MNEAASLLAIGIALLIGAASPGPSFIMVARSAASGGRRAGLQAALGMGLGGLIFAVGALLGLSATLAAAPKVFAALKLAGAAYLGYLAFRLWQGAKQPLEIQIPLSTGRSTASTRHFLLGFFTQISNPKTVIVYASVFAALLPSSPGIEFHLLVAILVFAIEAGWYATVALILSSDGAQAVYVRCKVWIDRLSGVMMGVLAAKLAGSVIENDR